MKHYVDGLRDCSIELLEKRLQESKAEVELAVRDQILVEKIIAEKRRAIQQNEANQRVAQQNKGESE